MVDKSSKKVNGDIDMDIRLTEPELVDTVIDGLPFSNSLEIVVVASALSGMLKHASTSPKFEVGGVMLGECFDSGGVKFVEVTGSIAAENTQSSPAHVQFTNKTWEQFEKVRHERFPKSRIIGWYHTHPGLGVFMSRDDVFVHNNAFSQPWHIALVIDPIRDTYSFFCRDEEQIVARPNILIKADRSTRKSGSLFKPVTQSILRLERALMFWTDNKELTRELETIKVKIEEKLDKKKESLKTLNYEFVELIDMVSKMPAAAISQASRIFSESLKRVEVSTINTKKIFRKLQGTPTCFKIYSQAIYFLNKRSVNVVKVDSSRLMVEKKIKVRIFSICSNGEFYSLGTDNILRRLNIPLHNLFATEEKPVTGDGFTPLTINHHLEIPHVDLVNSFAVEKDLLCLAAQKNIWMFRNTSIHKDNFDLIASFQIAKAETDTHFKEIEIDSYGNILLLDVGMQRLIKIDSEGSILFSLEKANEKVFKDVLSMCLIENEIYLLDAGENRILKFDIATGKFLLQYNLYYHLKGDKVTGIFGDKTGLFLRVGNQIIKILDKGIIE